VAKLTQRERELALYAFTSGLETPCKPEHFNQRAQEWLAEFEAEIEEEEFKDNSFFWFCFTFSGKLSRVSPTCLASAFLGLPEGRVTKEDIKLANKQTRLMPGARLVCCAPLGEMTEAEFKGETEKS
jgi:hypothetical protein